MTISRREFLESVAAAAAIAPILRPSRLGAADAIVRHASIGASGMAWSDIESFATHPAFTLVAVADVDVSRAAQVKARFPEARIYQDWRELLKRERKNLDSINVSTPDHMHATIAMAAMRMGLHVYCQKPLAATVREVRRLTEHARAHRVLTQMGIQVSSMPSQRIPEAVVKSGVIGKIKEVHTFCEKAWGEDGLIAEGADPVPPSLDWNGWLGVAPERPFKQGLYHPAEWRKRVGFGTGTLGDMGCHIFSPPYRALGLTAPQTVTSHGPAPTRDNWGLRARVHYVFPGTSTTAGPTVDFWWYDGGEQPPDSVLSTVADRMPRNGSVWVGTEGTLVLPHMDPAWFLLPADKFISVQAPEVTPRDHYHEFLEGVQTRQSTPLSAGFQYAGPLTESVLLGTVAMHLPGETLTWDARKMKFRDHEAANQFLSRTPRKGWKQKGL
jgi:predicted dehydrogenase